MLLKLSLAKDKFIDLFYLPGSFTELLSRLNIELQVGISESLISLTHFVQNLPAKPVMENNEILEALSKYSHMATEDSDVESEIEPTKHKGIYESTDSVVSDFFSQNSNNDDLDFAAFP